jgi:polysaccharide biosynthesis transport protein
MIDSLPNVEEIDFQKYLQVLQRRWLPAVGIFGVIVTAASVYAFSLKPTYEAQGSVLIKSDNTYSLTGLGENLGRIQALTQEGSPLETQAKIVTSVPVIQETIKSLNLKDKEGKAVEIEALVKKLKVKGAVGTDVLEISYTDDDPKLAAQVVNKVIDLYINRNVTDNQAEAISARKFIWKQLPEREQAVKQEELALRKFKEDNKVLVLQEEASNAVKTISDLEAEITKAQADLVEVERKLVNLRSQAKVQSEQAATYADLSQIKGTQDVLTQLQQAESLLKVEKTRFQPGHPAVINLEEKVAALKGLLNERTEQITGSNKSVPEGNIQIGELRQELIGELITTENQYNGLSAKISQLQRAKFNYQQRAQILPKLEQTQRELERRLKAAQTTYETLLTKLQEVDVAQNQRVGNARIISSALVPSKPNGPRRIIFIGAGAVAGIVLGIIAAFGLDLVDRSLKTVKEAKELFKYTLLGVIPNISKRARNRSELDVVEAGIPRVATDFTHYPLGDAYQMLRANLKFLSSDHELRAFTITSSISKEGKSEVAANLALAMTQVGRRVLIVDADMRHPIQHHIWYLNNNIGLSNLLVEQMESDKVIQEVMPNLFVLPSGVLPPNPLALLDSMRMSALVDEFVRDYDFVIFDTPALAGTADAAVIGNLTDGTLLVVRPGVIDYASANAAKAFLTQTSQKVLGMVINGVNVRREPDSYFYYNINSIETVNVSQNKSVKKAKALQTFE